MNEQTLARLLAESQGTQVYVTVVANNVLIQRPEQTATWKARVLPNMADAPAPNLDDWHVRAVTLWLARPDSSPPRKDK